MFTFELRNAHIRPNVYAEVIIFAWVLLREECPQEGDPRSPSGPGWAIGRIGVGLFESNGS